MSKLVNCEIENIRLKITNNTNVDIPIEIMRLFPQGVNKTQLVQWDISGESFDTNYVSLATTVPLVGYAKTLDINGVVDVLNSFKVATFFYVGTIIYAVNLINPSVATADLIIGTAIVPPSFNIGTGFNSQTYSTPIQADGKIIVGGGYTSYNGTGANRIIRLNTDGSIDGTFAYGTGFNTNIVYNLTIQTDGKIVVVGGFTLYQGISASRIVRLNTDGSIDGTFVYGTGFNNLARVSVIQADGKIIIGGQFGAYNGFASSRIVRLNTDGSIDGTFIIGTGFNSTVHSLALQTDGKIIVGGAFTSYNGTPANSIVRLNPDGSIDGTFIYGTGLNNVPNKIAVQSDGKIIVTGIFSLYNGIGANRIIRLNTDGSIDGTFVYGTGFDSLCNCVTVQPDGKILIGGDFTDYNGMGANKIIRLNTDGSIDGTFVYGIGFDSDVRDIAIQADLKIICVGAFVTYQSIAYNRMVRLNINGSTDTLT